MKILTDRKEMAQALNFGKYPVLTYDVDSKKGSKVTVTKESKRYGTMRYNTTLYRGKQTADDGIFYLLTHASMLTNDVDVNDWLEDAEYANAPVIDGKDQEVAILIHSRETNTAVVYIMKTGNVDPTYVTACTFYDVD